MLQEPVQFEHPPEQAPVQLPVHWVEHPLQNPMHEPTQIPEQAFLHEDFSTVLPLPSIALEASVTPFDASRSFAIRVASVLIAAIVNLAELIGVFALGISRVEISVFSKAVFFEPQFADPTA